MTGSAPTGDAAPGTGATLRMVTWNVHRGRGNDGRVDPARTAAVIVEEICGAPLDVLALQEADEETPPHAGFLDLDHIAARTGLVCAHADPALRWGAQSHGFLGSIVFLHPRIAVTGAAVLDLPGHCHRGAVVIEAECDGAGFRLVAVHLSLGQLLRAAQMRTIGQYLFRSPARPTILVGDLNEWRPWGGLAFAPRLVGMALKGPARATFPVNRPFLPLDRVLAGPGASVQAAAVLDSPAIRMASDHRPLRAEVKLEGGAAGTP